MLTLPAAATIHLARDSRRLTIGAVVYKRDGSAIRCTQHDDDLEITSGDFSGIYFSTTTITASDIQSSSDLSTDNLEVQGAIADDITITGFTVADIEAGLFDHAPFETFLCQWDNPNAWQKSIRRGYLGQISRTSEGTFQCEWRGILQLLQQNIGKTYGETCDVARFGDARCKFDASALDLVGTVSSVVSRRRFNVTFDFPPSEAAGYFELGEITMSTGAARGYRKQIKRDTADGSTLGALDMWESFPADLQVGDRIIARPGCDRRFETCQRFSNTINFRGHGRWIPGIPNIIRAP